MNERKRKNNIRERLVDSKKFPPPARIEIVMIWEEDGRITK